MGRKSRDSRLELEWLRKYGKEATGIIIDLVTELQEAGENVPEPLQKRINRLKAASALWDEIKKQKEVFVP